MSKNLIVIVITAFSITGVSVFAQNSGTSVTHNRGVDNNSKTNDLGIGLQVGSLSGVNAEYWTSPSATVNAALTFDRYNTAATISRLWMFRDAFGGGQASYFVPFIGIGALGAWSNNSDSDYFRRRNDESFILAAQVPMGIEFLPRAQRFGIFAELQPSLEIIPATYGFIMGDVGARLYF